MINSLRTIVKSESLVVFLASSNKRLKAPLFRILALLHASSAKKQIIQIQWRSSASVNGFNRSVAVIRAQAVVTASASFSAFLPFDLTRLDRIFNDCARNGLSLLAKKVMQQVLYRFW